MHTDEGHSGALRSKHQATAIDQNNYIHVAVYANPILTVFGLFAIYTF